MKLAPRAFVGSIPCNTRLNARDSSHYHARVVLGLRNVDLNLESFFHCNLCKELCSVQPMQPHIHDNCKKYPIFT